MSWEGREKAAKRHDLYEKTQRKCSCENVKKTKAYVYHIQDTYHNTFFKVYDNGPPYEYVNSNEKTEVNLLNVRTTITTLG